MALKEHIVKLANGKYRLLSHTGKNLGTFDSHEAAAKHEGEVEWFKAHEEAEPKKYNELSPKEKEEKYRKTLDKSDKAHYTSQKKVKSFKEFQGDKVDVHNSDQESDSEM